MAKKLTDYALGILRSGAFLKVQGGRIISADPPSGGSGTPSSTVAGETTFGISSAAGSATTYSRGDHTHGTPTDPVTAHVAASDPHTGYQRESEKGAASGYASLNGSTLVTENPANATATPTASKIPIADGSGKLDGWVTPDTWEGKVVAAMGDGDPYLYHWLGLSSATGISPAITPTNIGATVGRLVAFRLRQAITVTTIRWFGIGAVSGIYTAAIYRDSDGSRLWNPGAISTSSAAWSSAGSLSISLAADTLYWFGIGANTTGSTAGFCGPALPRVGATGLASPAFTGLTTAGLRFCQVTLTAGSWPSPLPALVNAGSWTGFIPVFYLCASGY